MARTSVYAVTAQHAYETDGVPGRNERAIPEADGAGLVRGIFRCATR